MSTHWRLGSWVWKSRRIVGMATVSTVLSSTTMISAITTMASVIQRLGSRTGVVSSTAITR